MYEKAGETKYKARGIRYLLPCDYYDRALNYPPRDTDTEDNHAPVPLPCNHGGMVHTRCMLEHAEAPCARS